MPDREVEISTIAGGRKNGSSPEIIDIVGPALQLGGLAGRFLLFLLLMPLYLLLLIHVTHTVFPILTYVLHRSVWCDYRWICGSSVFKYTYALCIGIRYPMVYS